MGYYDKTDYLSGMMNLKPYDIRGLREATQMLTGGLQGGADTIRANRGEDSQFRANMRVSDLLGNMDTNNYEAQMQQASGLLPYASQDMQQLARTRGQDVQNKRSYDMQKATFDMQKRDYDNKQQSMAAIQGLLGGNPEAYMNATPEAKYLADMAFKQDSEKMVGDAVTNQHWDKTFKQTQDNAANQLGLGYAQLAEQRRQHDLNAAIEAMKHKTTTADNQYAKYGGLAYNPATGKTQRMPDRTTQLREGWVMMPSNVDVSKLHTMVTKEGGMWKPRDANKMAATTKFTSELLGTPEKRAETTDKLVKTLGSQWWFGRTGNMPQNQKLQLESQINNLLNDPKYADQTVQSMNNPNDIFALLKAKAGDDALKGGRGEYIKPAYFASSALAAASAAASL